MELGTPDTDKTNVPFFQQPFFWLGLALFLFLITGFIWLRLRVAGPNQTGWEGAGMQSREDLLRGLSGGNQILVSDAEKEKLAESLAGGSESNKNVFRPKDREELLKMLGQ